MVGAELVPFPTRIPFLQGRCHSKEKRKILTPVVWASSRAWTDVQPDVRIASIPAHSARSLPRLSGRPWQIA